VTFRTFAYSQLPRTASREKTGRNIRGFTAAFGLAVAFVSLLATPNNVSAGSAGDLDLSFDSDGWNSISGSGVWFEAASVVVQSTGKVVIAGARMNGFQFDPLIARFNTDGSLDTTFGSSGTGVVVEPWPSGETIMEWINRSGAAVDVALLSDDRIVVTSSPSGDNEKHGIMLFTADGVLDTSFDGDGRRKIASGGPAMDVWTTAVTVTSDDKIMFVGTSPDNGWDYRMKVYRLNTDGSNDTSFNNDGMRNVYFPSSVDNLANAVVMSGDKTIYGGSAAASWSRHDMGIGQMTAEGRNDTAFASGAGRTYVDFGFGDSDVRELLVQADGKIVAIGESQVFDNDDSVAVTRLNADGSLDTSFSGDGKFAYDFGTGDSYGWAGAVDASGRILVAGQYNNGANDKAFVMRLTGDGELDTTFGTGGIRTYDFNSANAESFNAIALSGSSMIVAGLSGSSALTARLQTTSTLTVTYDSQGGSTVTDGDTTTTTGGSISTLPTDPTRDGYTFTGWYTAASGGTQITAGAAHGQTSDFTLYAQWTTNTLTVTYDSQGGSTVTDGDTTTTAGGSISTLPTDPTRDGYTFTGWHTAASGGTQITAGAAHSQTSDFTLYAQWTANPTTTTTAVPTTTTTVPTTTTPPAAPPPTTTTITTTTTTTVPTTTTAPTTTVPTAETQGADPESGVGLEGDPAFLPASPALELPRTGRDYDAIAWSILLAAFGTLITLATRQRQAPS
jgi:uncharacterized delta-60 repeat protein/uncharacterized repeat protein (TIGR02543 family)